MVGPTKEVIVGSTTELQPGSVTIVDQGRFGIGVINVNGTYHALLNYCPHRGAPLCKGRVTGTTVAGAGQYDVEWTKEGEVLRCPWHGWEFNIASGETLTSPTRRVKSFPVEVRDGNVILHVPADSRRIGGIETR